MLLVRFNSNSLSLVYPHSSFLPYSGVIQWYLDFSLIAWLITSHKQLVPYPKYTNRLIDKYVNQDFVGMHVITWFLAANQRPAPVRSWAQGPTDSNGIYVELLPHGIDQALQQSVLSLLYDSMIISTNATYCRARWAWINCFLLGLKSRACCQEYLPENRES